MKLNTNKIKLRNFTLIPGDVDDLDGYLDAHPELSASKSCTGYMSHKSNCECVLTCRGSCDEGEKCMKLGNGDEFWCACVGEDDFKSLPELTIKEAAIVEDGDIDGYIAKHKELKGKLRIYITPEAIECRGPEGSTCTLVLEEETQTLFCRSLD